MGGNKRIIEKYVRDHGIQQFINLYKQLEKKSDSIYSDDSDQSAINNCDSLKWGDEVSCHFLLHNMDGHIVLCIRVNEVYVWCTVYNYNF